MIFIPPIGSMPRFKSKVLKAAQGPYCAGKFAPVAFSVQANTRPVPLKIWTCMNVAPVIRGKNSMEDWSGANVGYVRAAARLAACGLNRRLGRIRSDIAGITDGEICAIGMMED